MSNEIRIPISSDGDIVIARQQGRIFANSLGFTQGDLTLIATAISELARNIIEHAQKGEILLRVAQKGSRRGIEIVASDEGPGISDIPLAMQDGYSSRRSLGLGLPGTKRLVDEFEIVSHVGKGTMVTIRKWEE
ncbi:MAG TPA: anti-sigma regulatory factor [Bacteroidota bacterium]|nr:anti-sigma regulatory factor [Bacteroidota bacterium]